MPEDEHVVPLGRGGGRAAKGTTSRSSRGAPRFHAACGPPRRWRSENVSAEVLDLRTLSPLDEEAILRSLAKTGRLVIVHDAVAPFGGGAEIAAIAASAGFASLRAPVVRVTPPFAPSPLPSSLQTAYYPQPDDIVGATLALLDRRTVVA